MRALYTDEGNLLVSRELADAIEEISNRLSRLLQAQSSGGQRPLPRDVDGFFAAAAVTDALNRCRYVEQAEANPTWAWIHAVRLPETQGDPVPHQPRWEVRVWNEIYMRTLEAALKPCLIREFLEEPKPLTSSILEEAGDARSTMTSWLLRMATTAEAVASFCGVDTPEWAMQAMSSSERAPKVAYA